jgi:hypothetical protein
MTNSSKALSQSNIAESAPSFKMFVAPEYLHMLPGFVIAGQFDCSLQSSFGTSQATASPPWILS